MIWYTLTELDEQGVITTADGSIIKQVVTSFFTNRNFDPTSAGCVMIKNLTIEHFLKMEDLGYRFVIPGFNIVGEKDDLRVELKAYLDMLFDNNSALLLMYAQDAQIAYGQKDTNTWVDNNRKLEVATDYGSTSETGTEDSPIGSTYDSAITTPTSKSKNKIEGDSSRSETKSGSSTETRIRIDNTEMIKQLWNGAKNFDGVLNNILSYLTHEYCYCE